jgi:glycosyltransferase involved in cell wall biosynthesis
MEEFKRLCLCMIVKNESKVIARALQSARPIIDYWVICDTGSTDDTPAIILNTLFDIPGELHSRKWANFGENRTEVLQLARGKAEYLLVMDADMVVHTYGDFKSRLTADYYNIRYEGNLDYSQAMLLANRHDWAYVGATHEYPYSPTAAVASDLDILTLSHFGDGGSRLNKFERDIQLLTAELDREPENPRNVFYLAQSYKDIGDHQNALVWYRRRVEMGGWEEEQWYAMYQVACMQQDLGEPWDDLVLQSYLKAYQCRPWRLEPIFHIAKYYREREAFALGYLYSSIISFALIYPRTDQLFIERSVYDYLLLLEHGVCAFSTGRPAEAISAFNAVLQKEKLPEWVADSAMRGRRMSLEVLFPGRPVSDSELKTNRLKVLVPYHNAGQFFNRCLESLLAQDYSHFEVLLCDDASVDGASDQAPRSDKRFRLIRNQDRRFLAHNLHTLITQYCEPEDIVVLLDGDDWLSGSDTLTHINRFYEEQECWVMYGQFEMAHGEYGFSQPFASSVDFLTLRQQWRCSHIKTFRAGLYHKIADQDPNYSCMKDEHEGWLKESVDAALMFPLLEMAGFDRVRYCDRILYVYNFDNPASHHHQNLDRQAARFNELKNRRPFARVANYRP